MQKRTKKFYPFIGPIPSQAVQVNNVKHANMSRAAAKNSNCRLHTTRLKICFVTFSHEIK